MTDTLPLDRLLIVAPHPDDDVISSGGLIQRVVAAGGEVRVLFVTDGENNPWPQRREKRSWRISTADHAAWGARRRSEARAGLATLGVPASNITFISLPDQRTANLVRRGDSTLHDAIVALLLSFRPTVVVIPSWFDLHVDHRATSYFAHTALANLDGSATQSHSQPRLLTYVVHGRAPASRLQLTLSLDPAEQEKKRAAIEHHTSQMLLSRERFLAYAGATESFYSPEFDLVRVESRFETFVARARHAWLVCFGSHTAERQGEGKPE